MMITAYGMYNWPEAIPAITPFWVALHERLSLVGFDVHNTLSQDRDAYDVWLDPDLLLAQTCGYPYATRLRGSVQLVATPHYDVEGCSGSSYRSVILKRQSDPRSYLADFCGATAAVNSFRSQSGCNALLGTLAREKLPAPFLNNLVCSGSHRASMQMVALKQADICAIDAVCWQLMQDFEPNIAKDLVPITWSDAQPGLPFITTNSASTAQLDTLRQALSDTLSHTAHTLPGFYIDGFSILNDGDYDGITKMTSDASEAGFGTLLELSKSGAL